MPPRVDSPSNFERVMDEEEDVIEDSSLTSRPLRRVPTPMGQSHTTGNNNNAATRDRGDSLFDSAETSERGASNAKTPRSPGLSDAFFFGTDFETLSSLKNQANYAASRGRQSLKDLVYGSPSAAAPRGRNGHNLDDKSQSSRALSLFNAITKPFMACSANIPKELDDAMGDLVASAATVVAAQRSPSSDDYSKNYSYDDDYDEARQMRRMTSWNTLETNYTAMSYLTDGTDTPLQTIFDDDGNPIPNVLVDLTKEMRQKRTRRKRVVKFDYPPISSLKECPRPDPDDLPNLYFTEEELNQIEDDRASTTVADDVEVVCVSASESSESPPPYESRPLRELGEVDESDTTSLLHQNENDSQQASQQKQRRYRGRSPAPRSKKLFGRGGNSNGRQGPSSGTHPTLPPKYPLTPNANVGPSSIPPDPFDDGESQASQTSQASAASSKPPKHGNGSKRLIKSVHIFMRERSRERSAEI